MIAFRTSASGGAVNTLQLDVTIPAAVQVGDLMILAGVSEQPHALDSPSGWTPLRAGASTALPAVRVQTWYRFATVGDVGGATTVPVIPTTGSHYCSATLTAWSGVDSIDTLTDDGDSSAVVGTSLVAPSITTTVPDSLTVQVYVWASNPATITVPTTFRVQQPIALTVSGGDFNQVQASEAVPVAGATGTKVATASAAVSWVTIHVALLPAATGGGWGVGMVRMGAN